MTDLLRLDRFSIETTANEGGKLIVTVRSKEPDLPRCCLLSEPKRNGTKTVRFRDFPVQAQPVWLAMKRQRAKCLHCDAVLYENLPDFDTEFRLTSRFRDWLFEVEG